MTRSGIGYRDKHRRALLEGAGPKPEILEIMAGHFFGNPGGIEALAGAFPLVFHEVGFSLGTAAPGPLDAPLVRRVRELVGIAKPLLVSDHVALTRSPAGVDLGHLCPIWYTPNALNHVAQRVAQLQDALGVGFAVENIAAPFVIEGGMSEPEFFTRLVEKTGCSVLLDLSNLAINAANFGFDATSRLHHYPLHAVRQVHLAGGSVEHSWRVDSHSAPVDAESYGLLSALRGLAPLEAIVIERDSNIPTLDELVAEAHAAKKRWEGS